MNKKDKKVHLCREPFSNVDRHLEEQLEPARGKKAVLVDIVKLIVAAPKDYFAAITVTWWLPHEVIYWNNNKTFSTSYLQTKIWNSGAQVK